MIFHFIETSLFTRRSAELLDDESYRELENELLRNPTKGEVIPGCGGIRKMRLGSHHRSKGKRNGLRIIYLLVPEIRYIYLVTIYGKDEADDLDATQKKRLRSLALQTKELLLKQHRQKKD